MASRHRTRNTIVLAGTDTDVGKTYVASLLAKHLRLAGHRVGVYKPVASGCQRQGELLIAEDAIQLWQAAGKPGELAAVCPQRFLAPLAPPEAAAAEGRVVDAELLVRGADVWLNSCDVLIIEGAGGLFSPLADQMLNIDLLSRFPDGQLVIVADDSLGVIHRVLATCQAALYRGVRPAGIVLSRTQASVDESVASNLRQIARYSEVPVLGRVEHGATEIDVAIVDALNINTES